MKLPNARTTDILVQSLNGETLIYDQKTNKSYCLNSTSAIVFAACNGETTLEQLKSQHDLPDEIVFLALDELKKNDLIKDEYFSPFAGMSRREMIRKAGLASMIALPIVSSLVAPAATSAASSVCGCGAAANSNARLQNCSCASNDDCCGVCQFNGGNPICSAPTAAAQPNAAACCPPLVP
jgi:hypothetical protein